MFKFSKKVILFTLSAILSSSVVYSNTAFNSIVVATFMDVALDNVYKTLPETGNPVIYGTKQVYPNQWFNLFVAFENYSLNSKKQANIVYDYEVYDPQGNLTTDKDRNLLGSRLTIKNINTVLPSADVVRLMFTDDYPFGLYTIKVKAYDKVSKRTDISETLVELIKPELTNRFSSSADVGQWVMDYHTEFNSIMAVDAALKILRTDQKFLDENMHILTFFKIVFSENAFLFDLVAENFNSYRRDEQAKLIMLAALTKNNSLDRFVKQDLEFKKLYKLIRYIKFPRVDREIDSALQLDILWSEFFATGKYQPISKIIASLELRRYAGSINKLNAVKKENRTPAMVKDAEYEAVFSSAIWSLMSNSSNSPLVYKYCAYAFSDINISSDIRNQLGTILYEINKQKRSGTSQKIRVVK